MIDVNITMNKLKDIQQDSAFIAQIKKIIFAARQKSYMAVNFAMVEAYWLMGRRIVEEEQQGNERAAYGEKILKTLSKELTKEFGKGFSERNLRDFRQFFLTFQETEIWHTLCAKLSWSHIRLIMRVENKDAQKYYLQEAAENHWSVRTFGHKNYILPFQGAHRYHRQSAQGVAIGLEYKWFSTIPNAPKGHYNPTQWQRLGVNPTQRQRLELAIAKHNQ